MIPQVNQSSLRVYNEHIPVFTSCMKIDFMFDLLFVYFLSVLIMLVRYSFFTDKYLDMSVVYLTTYNIFILLSRKQ